MTWTNNLFYAEHGMDLNVASTALEKDPMKKRFIGQNHHDSSLAASQSALWTVKVSLFAHRSV